MLCECGCGCGDPAPIALRTRVSQGMVKGQPQRFICGHNRRGVKFTDAMRAKQSARAKKGAESFRWTGGRRVKPEGYVLVYVDGREVYEHRRVMAEAIGRPLTDDEVVHHINEIKDDNRLENLMLFPNQAAHVAHHNRERVPA